MTSTKDIYKDEPIVPARYPGPSEGKTSRREYWATRTPYVRHNPPEGIESLDYVDAISIEVKVTHGGMSVLHTYALVPGDRTNIPEAIMVNAAKLGIKGFEQIEVERLSNFDPQEMPTDKPVVTIVQPRPYGQTREDLADQNAS